MVDAKPDNHTLDLEGYRRWIAGHNAGPGGPEHSLFITISRQFGCEGYEIARRLVELINQRAPSPWRVFTRPMIEQMASGEHLAVDRVREVSGGRRGLRERFLDTLAPRALQSPSSQVFARIRDIILDLVERGDCVLLGGGAQIITHRLDPRRFTGLHARVVAGRAWRVERIQALYGLSGAEAEETLEARQGARDAFIADFTGLSADDPELYDVIFNNARNTAATMADVLMVYAEKMGAAG
ncbi:MAG: cytidylate kinase-like family protein [Nitrospinae bacterium]|nr:cytidylate kinase-like family protein [Nitrospinota bacterium]